MVYLPFELALNKDQFISFVPYRLGLGDEKDDAESNSIQWNIATRLDLDFTDDACMLTQAGKNMEAK